MIKSLLYTIRNGDSLSRSVADKLSFLRKYSFLTQKNVIIDKLCYLVTSEFTRIVMHFVISEKVEKK